MMKRMIAILLAAVMVLCLCAACGSKDEPAAEAAAPAAAPAEAAAPADVPADAAAPVEGEASGEPSGLPSGDPPAPEFYEPTDDYSKDFEGYRQYVIDAFANDPGAPEDLKEAYNAEFKAMTDDAGTTVQALIDLGLICSYQDFLNY